MKILYNKEVNCFEVREESKTGEITISGLSAGVSKNAREADLEAHKNKIIAYNDVLALIFRYMEGEEWQEKKQSTK